MDHRSVTAEEKVLRSPREVRRKAEYPQHPDKRDDSSHVATGVLPEYPRTTLEEVLYRLGCVLDRQCGFDAHHRFDDSRPSLRRAIEECPARRDSKG